jgi:hypothetical protein
VSSPPAAKTSAPGGQPATSGSTAPGHKRIGHPVVGILDLDFEAMEFPANPGLTLLACTAAVRIYLRTTGISVGLIGLCIIGPIIVAG